MSFEVEAVEKTKHVETKLHLAPLRCLAFFPGAGAPIWSSLMERVEVPFAGEYRNVFRSRALPSPGFLEQQGAAGSNSGGEDERERGSGVCGAVRSRGCGTRAIGVAENSRKNNAAENSRKNLGSRKNPGKKSGQQKKTNKK